MSAPGNSQDRLKHKVWLLTKANFIKFTTRDLKLWALSREKGAQKTVKTDLIFHISKKGLKCHK